MLPQFKSSITSSSLLNFLKKNTLIICTVFVLTACDDSSGSGPVITLVGDSEIEWTQGFDYEDFGASAYDEIDGDAEVTQINNVNVNSIGAYTVTYKASDLEGNETVAKRTVNVVASTAFITTWTTTSTDKSIKISTSGTGYNYSIDWGDGSAIEQNKTGSATHTYAIENTYTVSISGVFPHLYYEETSTEAEKLTSVEQWGNTHWRSMENTFYGARNLVINATDTPILFNVISMKSMFERAINFNSDISSWDVSTVTDMSNMFDVFDSFNSFSPFNQPLNSWDVSNVTNMSNMFEGAVEFNQPLNDWDVSNVVNMSQMFVGNEVFNQPLNSWDVANVTNMSGMFLAAYSFDQSLENWDVSNVTTMSYMFFLAEKFNNPIGSWDVSNVTSMLAMFLNATTFNQSINNWDVSKVTDMSEMFWGAISFNQSLDTWDVSSVTDMRTMFSGATVFNQSLAIWDVSNVADVRYMFDESGLSSENYDALLNGWSIQILQPDLTFDVSAKYSSASEAARQSIIDTYNWTINDDGLQP
jgi:surface protein